MNNPINESKTNCVPTSSNCVKWQGPNIDWMSLCRDASVTEVILQLSNEIKSISDILNISEYDMACLDLGKCGPKSFDDLVQLIIDKLCSLNSSNGVDIDTLIVDIVPKCFIEYNEGDSASIATYANLIAEKVCNNIQRLNEIEETIEEHSKSIDALQTTVEYLQENKQDKLYIVGCNNENDVNSILQDTVNKMCEYSNVLGTIQELEEDNKCNVDYYPYYFSNPYSNIKNDISSNNTVADNIKNIWTVLCDLRLKVYELSKKTSEMFLELKSYITCDGTIIAKIDCTYDQDSYNIIFYKASITNVERSIKTVTTYVNDNTYHELWGNKTDDSYDISVIVGYKEMEESKTKRFTFKTYRIVTDATITKPANINENRIITFTKNIEDQVVKLTRTIGNGYLTTLKTFDVGTSGVLSYTDTDTMTYNTNYKYELKTDSCSFFDKTLKITNSNIVRPTINNGEYSDDNDKYIKNEVPLDEINDWNAKYINTLNE